MRFFNQRISQDQFLSGLKAAATGMSVVVSVLISILIAHDEPFVWRDVGFGLLTLGITAVYVGHKIRAARRGSITLSPNVAFVLTCSTVMTIVFAFLASDRWSGEMFLALLVLPLIFFAIIGDNQILLAGWLVTSGASAVCLHAEHLHADVFWARLVVYCSLYGVAGLMIAPMIRKLHNRFRSRDALSDLTKALATADSIESALTDSVTLIHTVIPCASVVLYARSPSDGDMLIEVATWSRREAPVRALSVGELPSRVELAAGAKLVGNRCFVAAGYASVGELTLVIDEIDTKRVSSFFAEEAASGLSSSLLLMTGRLAYVTNLREESRTDSLTGLANRRSLQERLELDTARAARTGSPLSVAMIDLDHFKAVNDDLGHARGDDLLRHLAAGLGARLRVQDLLARYGGEEFCVLLPDTDVDGALSVLEGLRAVASTILVAGRAASISAGVAEWRPGESTQALLERADKALYEAKVLGRNRVIAAVGLPRAA